MALSPNVLSVGDKALTSAGSHRVTVKAFIRSATGRQLVEVEYPDGSIHRQAFALLTRRTEND